MSFKEWYEIENTNFITLPKPPPPPAPPHAPPPRPLPLPAPPPPPKLPLNKVRLYDFPKIPLTYPLIIVESTTTFLFGISLKLLSAWEDHCFSSK